MSTAEQQTNGQLVRHAFENVLNSKDVSELRGFWTDRTEQRFPDKTCRGADEIIAYFNGVFAALEDFDMRVQALVESDDGRDVFVHWKLTGHHTGAPFQGIEATGKPVELQGMDHFVFTSDGTVESNTIVFDQLTFARQVGFIPEDGSGPDRAAKRAFNAKNRFARRFGR